MEAQTATYNEENEVSEASANPPTYWLTRFVILRLLGAIYAIAFLVAINQILPLIGSNGLLPVGDFIKNMGAALGSKGAAFIRLPSLFWFWHSDTGTAVCMLGWVSSFTSCGSGLC